MLIQTLFICNYGQALGSLNVELLVIPAVSEVRDTWTSVFGFEPLEVARKQMIKNFSLLVFPHADMLMKEIKKPKVADEDPVPIEGTCWYISPFIWLSVPGHPSIYTLFALLKI